MVPNKMARGEVKLCVSLYLNSGTVMYLNRGHNISREICRRLQLHLRRHAGKICIYIKQFKRQTITKLETIANCHPNIKHLQTIGKTMPSLRTSLWTAIFEHPDPLVALDSYTQIYKIQCAREKFQQNRSAARCMILSYPIPYPRWVKPYLPTRAIFSKRANA